MDRQNLTSDIILKAYQLGVFPMSESRDDPNVFWVDPRYRGVIPLDGFHISRSLAKCIRKTDFRIAVDEDFAATIEACAERSETWISDTIFDLYCQLHDLGHAHSIEVRDESGLVGGVYGICLGAAFFGESMFSRRKNASKIALAFLVDKLRQSGFQLFDTQFITPHLRRLGAVEITRAEYHERLDAALAVPADFHEISVPPSAQGVLQRNAQTS